MLIALHITRWKLPDLVAVCTIAFCCLMVFIDKPILVALPIIVLALLVVLADLSVAYYLFFALLPFSIEVDLPGGFATDLPTEPLMWIIMIYGVVLFLIKLNKIDLKLMRNPITTMVFLHVLWIMICTYMSGDQVISFKWFLAKMWYVIPFYFGTYFFITSREQFLKAIQLTLWPLILAILIVNIRHSATEFSFEEINKAVWPIFRNHVNYASTLVMFLPFVWALYSLDHGGIKKLLYGGAIGLIVVAIYLSYTRAAILCLGIGLVAYFIIKWRMLLISLFSSVVILSFFIGMLVYNNNYVNFAPEYDKAISHTDFQNLIDATYKLEDISTMERVHRWVAGAHMIAEKPIFGFGPGTFYSFYEPYTVNIFRTYVSDNPEHSGIHSYYLMTSVEQGIIGLLIFVSLVVVTLLFGQSLYHKLILKEDKIIVMACMISMICTLSINLINDMFEVDKIGPYFFFCLAMLGVVSYRFKQVN
jgi:O-antigen ligase